MEHFSEAEWVIENISCWNEEVHGRRLRSPTFTSSLWFFLYPRGESGREERMEVDIRSFKAPIPPGELSFLCSDGSLIHSQQVVKQGFLVLGTQLGEVSALIKEKEGDRFTLRYRFKSEEEDKQKSRTVIDVIDTTLKIDPVALGCGKRISDFPFQKNTDDYCAELFSFRNENVTKLRMDLSVDEDIISVKTCVSFLKIGDVLEKYEEKEHVFRDEDPWVFFSINERDLAERGTAILLRVKIITGIMHSEPSLLTEGVSVVPNKCACFPEQVSQNPIVTSDHTYDSLIALSKELMCVFQDQDFSDFQLKCGGVSLPVHRAVLSARSPVFKRLLSSDMREAASGSVDIEDLDAPTLARFLAFLYTGSVEDLDGDSAIKLYYAADKYEVSTLKKECVKCLCADISVVNVCDILSLADKHSDDQLTKASHNFLLNHLNKVSRSEQWKSFMKKEPMLALETLTHFVANDYVTKRDPQ